jgi:hypothetical protein
MKPTSKQLDILRHSLGWPKNYRNHFSTGDGSKDFADCEALVAAGLMERREISWIPDNVYFVTELGRAVAESGGEQP